VGRLANKIADRLIGFFTEFNNLDPGFHRTSLFV
jgi:hypothetical protein